LKMNQKYLSPLLSLVLFTAVPFVLYAEETDSINQIAIEAQKAMDEAAAKAKKEAAAAKKAEETRQANAAEVARIAELQRKCEKKGGDWKRGKCVMPSPPAPKPVPVVEPAAAASSGVIAPQMVNIPAGTFTMGCVEGRDDVVEDSCSDDEKPAHQVTLNAFQIGKYEVTFAEWDACETAKVCPHADDEGWGRGKRPVINVSWDDAQTYIRWLNAQTGQRYRLPTEAEWEYAARGGRDSAYPWGNSISCNNADYWPNSTSCHGRGTSVVGSFAANAYGLHDTVGNVYEWCQDWYGEGYYASSPASNPEGAAGGTDRVLRGGSWYDTPRYVRSATRDYNAPDNRYYLVGFRVAQGQ
jgi:formylglycine-generating enzyme required for sulfatase activity